MLSASCLRTRAHSASVAARADRSSASSVSPSLHLQAARTVANSSSAAASLHLTAAFSDSAAFSAVFCASAAFSAVFCASAAFDARPDNACSSSAFFWLNVLPSASRSLASFATLDVASASAARVSECSRVSASYFAISSWLAQTVAVVVAVVVVAAAVVVVAAPVAAVAAPVVVLAAAVVVVAAAVVVVAAAVVVVAAAGTHALDAALDAALAAALDAALDAAA